MIPLYGGGAGMVMQAAPVRDAYEALCERIDKASPRPLHDSQGQTFNQKIVEESRRKKIWSSLLGIMRALMSAR